MNFPIMVIPGLLALLVSNCSMDRSALDRKDNLIVLLDPELGLDEEWEHRRLKRNDTEYVPVETELGYSLQATGNQSASILYRFFAPVSNCNKLRWSWWVGEPQSGSDLHIKGKDDVAASVFVMFGDPGLFQDNPVPTLKYVWANKRHRKGEVITGPYLKKFVRSIVLRNDSASDQKMVSETVNLTQDYAMAFGEEPKDAIYGVAVFTDNDDTREPIVAHYGKIELLCRE